MELCFFTWLNKIRHFVTLVNVTVFPPCITSQRESRNTVQVHVRLT